MNQYMSQMFQFDPKTNILHSSMERLFGTLQKAGREEASIQLLGKLEDNHDRFKIISEETGSVATFKFISHLLVDTHENMGCWSFNLSELNDVPLDVLDPLRQIFARITYKYV